VLMRLTDIFLAFPRLILAIALVAALGPGLENAVLAIALTTWSPFARIARAEALTIRNSEFILVAQVQGVSTAGILLRHVTPLCLSSVIVRLTLDMAGIILTAAWALICLATASGMCSIPRAGLKRWMDHPFYAWKIYTSAITHPPGWYAQ